jgi:hypothetical protein
VKTANFAIHNDLSLAWHLCCAILEPEASSAGKIAGAKNQQP